MRSPVWILGIVLPSPLLPSAAQRADSVVTFNEIDYHPDDPSAPEWIELHNQMAIRVDVSGWSLTGGVGYAFPEGTVIEPGGFLLVSSDPSHPSHAGQGDVRGPFEGRLSNGGEALRLRGRHGRVMDEFEYGDDGVWPVAPDGGGVTLAKSDPHAASGRPRSWTWSAQAGGTPGGANFGATGGETRSKVIGLTSDWSYTTGEIAGVEWREAGFDDGAWQGGTGSFVSALVQNPSFEAETFTNSPGYVSGNGAITAWSTLENGAPGGESRVGLNTPGGVDPFSNNGAVPHGSNVAFIRGGVRAIQQSVSGLEVGARYLLSYRENGRSPTNPIGSASLGGVEVVPQHPVTAVEGLGVFDQPYHPQVGAAFTATSGTAALELRNHAGIGDTILLDAVRVDPVTLFHSGAGAVPVHRAFSPHGDTLVLHAEVDPGTGGTGVQMGFKVSSGAAALATDGALWFTIDDGGEAVLRADESGGDHVVGLSNGAPVNPGTNRVALVWERQAGRASLVVNHVTVFNRVDLDATAGGLDGRFDPNIAGASATFDSAGGSLDELAVSEGADADTVLPAPAAGSTYRFRSEFALATLPASASLLLELETGGTASVFLNGVLLHQGAASGDFLLSADALVAGDNALAVELSGGGSYALAAGLTIIDHGEGSARAPLRLTEIDSAASGSFFVEVQNTGGAPVELSIYAINGTPLPGGNLAGGEFRAFAATELDLSPADEAPVFLSDAAGVIADAERIENRLRALDPASGRWQRPAVATPGAANAFAFDRRVVINEIHYHNRPTYAEPARGVAFAEDSTEWIELLNRSNETVELTGWSLRDGVSYDFPAGTMLPAGEFLVVSGVEFSGTLSNKSDRIHLRDANDNSVDAVTYFDDKPWPRAADGRGSSLERRHPDADGSLPGSWAASDGGDDAVWQTFTYRGTGAEPPGNNNPDFFHEFLMGMLADGTTLVDDISVIEDPDGAAIELVQNGGFEADPPGGAADKWRIFGNHRDSHVVELAEGGRALKLVATGALEHSYNIASTTFANGRTIRPGATYEISFRAKWVSGSPQLNTRLYFNRLARTHILPQPGITGTPGAANTALTAAAPPSISGLRHAPLVPAAGEAIRIHAQIETPDGVASADVHYDAGAGWQSMPMTADPEGGHLAILPGMPDGTVVHFYVEATADSGQAAFHPPAGPESRALIRVGDRSSGAGGGQLLRLIMLPEEADFMHVAHHTPSNYRVGTTVIYNDREVWYDAGARLRGSPYGRRGSRLGWNVKFPADRPFRGVHETLAIDGGFSIPRGDGTGWIQVGAGVATNELVYNQMAHRAGGVPSSFDDVAYIEAPRATDDKLAQLKMARFGDIWKSSSFDGGDRGSSFKFELIYHPQTTIDGNPESPKSVYNRVRGIDVRDMGADKEAYRHNFWIQNNTSRDDYAPVISAGMAVSEPPARLREATDLALDIDNWLRVMAFQSLTMTVDSYNNGLPHNMLLYANPESGKTMWVPWDVDHAFYSAPTTSIFGLANADFADVVQIPANRRAYCGHLLDLCNTGFDPAYIADWVTHFNEVGDQAIAAHFTQWITDRRNYVLGQLTATHPAQTFRITTNSGNDFSTSAPSVTLEGKGWIDVHSIRLGVDGEGLDVFWIDNDDWRIEVPLLAGANLVELAAFDFSGNPVGLDSITVTNTGAVESPSPGNLVVSEIMYHPPAPTAAEIGEGFSDQDDFEFLELENIGASTVEMAGSGFTAGLSFAFGSLQIPPGGRALVVRNQAAFEFRYGAGLPVAGEFADGTGLANGGERLRLADAGGATVRDFTYDDRHPWPGSADGDGFSLVLVAPPTNPDHSLASSWRSSATTGGNPGAGDATTFSGDPDADDDGDGLSNWMNYALGGSGPAFAPRVASSPGGLRFTHRRNLAADDVSLAVESSPDLSVWAPLAAPPAAEVSLGDGSSELSWSLPAGVRGFVRVRADARE